MKKATKTPATENTEATTSPDAIVQNGKVVDPEENMTRDWSLSTYLPLEAVSELCKQDFIAHYAYILHDKDKKPDGTPKEAHTHILLRLVNRSSFKALERRIKRFTYDYAYQYDIPEQNTFLERMQDPDGAFKYLTHSTREAREQGKYQYPITDIVSDHLGYWRGDYTTGQAEKKNTALDIITDIENGLTERQLLVRYGREYLINRRHYREFFDIMRSEEHRCVITYDENGEVVHKLGAMATVQRQKKEAEHALKKLEMLEKALAKLGELEKTLID